MDYRTLKAEHLAELRVERVVELEAEHARCAMRLDDAQTEKEAAAIRREMADLQARIAVHVAVIEANPPAAGPDGAQSDDPDAAGDPEPPGPPDATD